MSFSVFDKFKHGSAELCVYVFLLIMGEYIGFSMGTLCGTWLPLAAFCVWLLVALYGFGNASLKHLVLAAIFLFGLINAAKTEHERRRIIDENSGLYGEIPALELKVESEVDIVKKDKEGVFHVSFYSHLGAIPVKVKINVPSGGVIPCTGEVWKCKGWIGRQKKFDEKPYGCRTVWVGEAERVRIKSVTAFTITAFYVGLGKELSNRVSAGIEWSKEIIGINKAVLLGKRSEMSRKMREVFRNSGTIHLVAISGLHVGLIVNLLMGIFRRLEVKEPYLSMVAIPIIIGYTMLTGARPSAIRAAVMFVLWRIGPIFNRQPDILAVWSITALGVYVLSPEMIFDAGCTLSFAVMLGIVLWIKWTEQFNSLFENMNVEADVLDVSGEKVAAAKLRKRKMNFDEWLGSIGITFSAWIAGTPIVAMLFESITPGGLLANIIVIQISKCIVNFGMIGVLTSLICLPLGAIFNNLSALFVLLMIMISELVTKIPYCTFKVEVWTFWQCALWYAGWLMFFCFIGRFLPRKKYECAKWW